MGSDRRRPTVHSLPEDVVLLAARYRGPWRTRGRVDVVLAGALLAQEVRDGVPLPGPDAPETPEQRHRRLADVVLARAVTSLEEASAVPVRRGLLVPHERRWLFGVRRSLALADVATASDAVRRLERGLAVGRSPSPYDATLAVLCGISGIARSHVPPVARSRAAVREEGVRLAAHLNGLRKLVGPEVSDVLVAARLAYRRRVRDHEGSGDDLGGDPFVDPTGEGGGYGDSGGDGGGSGDGGGGDGGGGDGGSGGGD